MRLNFLETSRFVLGIQVDVSPVDALTAKEHYFVKRWVEDSIVDKVSALSGFRRKNRGDELVESGGHYSEHVKLYRGVDYYNLDLYILRSVSFGDLDRVERRYGMVVILEP